MSAAETHFTSLAAIVRGAALQPPQSATTETCKTANLRELGPESAPPAPDPRTQIATSVKIIDDRQADASAALHEARLFRAALADALEARVRALCTQLALTVLGRELALAPVDLAALLHKLIEENLTDLPLRVRVATGDADVACSLPTVVDATLRPGDAVLECRSGSIDARLHSRLALVMESR